jgi:hypothetical protein
MIAASAHSRAKTTRERAEPTIMGPLSRVDRREQYFLVAGGAVVCCSG